MKQRHRFLAILTALCLLGTLLPATVLATGGQMPGHLDDCSYCCNHNHTEDCGYAEAVGGQPCGHIHDETCGYAGETAQADCPAGADCTGGEDGHVDHADAIPGSPCCHTHDEGCGYAAAAEGQDCGHVCGEDEWVCAEGCPVAAADGEAEDAGKAAAVDAEAEGSYAALASDAQARYDTVAAALEHAADTDTLVIYGRVRWGGAAEQEYPGRAVTITGADEGASIVMNGADGRTMNGSGDEPIDESPNVTEFPCAVTFRAISLETSMGINFFYANGYRLEIDSDVTIETNGSICSNETSGSNLLAIGGSWNHTVDSAEMILNAGRYEAVIGGGMGQNVTGSTAVTVGGAATAGDVIGGGYRGDVGGSTQVTVNTAANKVAGGGNQGHVAGDTAVTINGSTSIYSVIGGCWGSGHVGGNTSVVISGDGKVTGGSVYGGCDSDSRALIATNNNQRYSKKANEQVMYPAPRAIAGEECYVGGSTAVTVAGEVAGGVYGGCDYPVRGNTSVTVSGTVGTSPDWYTGVYGSGNYNRYNPGADGSVGGNTYVEITESGKVLRELTNSLGVCGGVVGGGYSGAVKGDTMVVINGAVGNDVLGGTVFGGGARGGDVRGTANVVVNRPVANAAEQADDWFGFGAYGLGIGRVCGVYGGTFNGIMSGGTNVVINVDMGAAPVYGGSVVGNVDGSTAVTLNDGAGARLVMAGGGLECPMGYREEGTGLVGGGAAVTLKGSATAGTICGYVNYETDAGTARSVNGAATVLFDGCTGAVQQIQSMDLVRVANASDTTIDNEGRDNEQLINVADLTIDKGGKLHLLADAHILGNYAGDTAEDKGTLVISAGKTLTADGTVTGQTDISIVDTETDKPAEAQVYVVSGAGSTTESGDYHWIDRRTGLAMDWKANEDAGSQWWLVRYDEPVTPPDEPDVPSVTRYTVTVNYLSAEDGSRLAESYTIRRSEGSRYDVSAQAAKTIAGFTIDRVEGETEGALKGDVTVNVYYTKDSGTTPGGNPTPPVTEPETPDVNIDDGDVPTADLPEIPAQPETPDETVIVEGEVPLGDLPQTGTEAAQADPAVTLGLAALVLSLALAGVTANLFRRKEDAE